jgi:hypothetical protein
VGGPEHTHGVDILNGIDLVELGFANQLGEFCDKNDNFETNSLE